MIAQFTTRKIVVIDNAGTLSHDQLRKVFDINFFQTIGKVKPWQRFVSSLLDRKSTRLNSSH